MFKFLKLPEIRLYFCFAFSKCAWQFNTMSLVSSKCDTRQTSLSVILQLIVGLILTHFILILAPSSSQQLIVGHCRSLQIIVDHCRSLQVIVDHCRSFLVLVTTILISQCNLYVMALNLGTLKLPNRRSGTPMTRTEDKQM